MLLHLGAAAVKLNLSAVFRGSILSPAGLIVSFLVKISLGRDWFRRELNEATHGIRFFLFQMSRITFGRTTNREDDPGTVGRLERAILLVRRSFAVRPSVQDEGSYLLLSMTAL